MTGEEQIALWVDGDSRCPNDHDECCPDFSCCSPDLLWPKEKRLRFQAASPSERAVFLAGALGALMGHMGLSEQVISAQEHYAYCARCGRLKECRDVIGDGTKICFTCATDQEKDAYITRLGMGTDTP